MSRAREILEGECSASLPKKRVWSWGPWCRDYFNPLCSHLLPAIDSSQVTRAMRSSVSTVPFTVGLASVADSAVAGPR